MTSSSFINAYTILLSQSLFPSAARRHTSISSGTQIWLGVSWFRWQSVKAVWRDSGKPTFMSGVLRLASMSPRGCSPRLQPSLERLGVSPGTDASFLGKCRRSHRHFWSSRACLGYGPASDPPKKALCLTLPSRRNEQQIPSFSSQTWPFGWTHLSSVLPRIFCIYVLFVQYTFSPTFSSSVSSFWSPTGHNTSSPTLFLLPKRDQSVLRMTQNCIWWWGYSSGYLASMECPFIVIIPWSTISRRGSTF